MKQYKIFTPTTVTSTSVTCTNCSQVGHLSKLCHQPITSYGVILFRLRGGWKQADSLLQGNTTGIEGLQQHIEYLLIQRKDTIAFIEIMRGKYRTNDNEYIKQHLSHTTAEERVKLLTESFDTLWESLWGPPQEGSHNYKNEKEIARQKLEIIQPILADLIKESGEPWETPEWGFPKGRRENGESEYNCAMRELWEETNIYEKEIYPIRNMEPIREIFYGTNSIQYCHKYYIAYAPAGLGEEPIEDAALINKHIKQEVSAIKWLTFDEAVTYIRPENPEKRQVLLRVHNLLTKYCPLAVTNIDLKKSI
jgi:8-oxo-dGTP pyrophosphatase MutT (NUDIX family)